MKNNNLKKEIERLENAIWEEEMGDFINWNKYNKMKRELAEKKAELAA